MQCNINIENNEFLVMKYGAKFKKKELGGVRLKNWNYIHTVNFYFYNRNIFLYHFRLSAIICKEQLYPWYLQVFLKCSWS